MHESADLSLARERVEFTRSRMSLLAAMKQEYESTRPLSGMKIGVCIHLEPKTAVLLETLAAAGAQVVSTGNLGTTQDAVVAHLRNEGHNVIGSRQDSDAQHLANKRQVIASQPDLVLDNGAELASLIIADEIGGILGGTEETTTGANILRDGTCPYPILVINDSPLKLIFENEIGVGQSVLEAFMRETNVTPAAKNVTVVGFGWCGRGIANRFRDFGGLVTVVEQSPVAALDAAVHGFEVATLESGLRSADIVITATGAPNTVSADAWDWIRDGAIVANAGHFKSELDLAGLHERATSSSAILTSSHRYTLDSGVTFSVLAGGDMVNLVAGSGNPIGPMDMGLGLQARCLEHLASEGAEMSVGAMPVPAAINDHVALDMLRVLRGYVPAAVSEHHQRE